MVVELVVGCVVNLLLFGFVGGFSVVYCLGGVLGEDYLMIFDMGGIFIDVVLFDGDIWFI